MKQAKAWAKLKEKNIDDLIAKENRCDQGLDAALAEFQNLSRKAEKYDCDKLWPERIKLWKSISQETVDQLQAHFGRSFSHRRLQSAESDAMMHLEDYEYGLRQHLIKIQQRDRVSIYRQQITKKAKRECER